MKQNARWNGEINKLFYNLQDIGLINEINLIKKYLLQLLIILCIYVWNILHYISYFN